MLIQQIFQIFEFFMLIINFHFGFMNMIFLHFILKNLSIWKFLRIFLRKMSYLKIIRLQFFVFILFAFIKFLFYFIHILLISKLGTILFFSLFLKQAGNNIQELLFSNWDFILLITFKFHILMLDYKIHYYFYSIIIK